MKFAFLIMGDYDAERDHAIIGNDSARIVGVKDVSQACRIARQLQAEGVDCIELCGAFGPEATHEIISATGNTMPIGYITHLSEQDEVYAKAFGK